MKTDVLNMENKKAGSIDLDDAIFGLEPRADILHRCVVYQLAEHPPRRHQLPALLKPPAVAPTLL
ncbi:MAG: hypothetical protein AAFW68_13085, partial [Pseudomonadota bacterium]